MAQYNKKKKKHIETPAERVWVEKMLNASKKWNKKYKGEIIYTREHFPQDYVRYAWYNSREELEADATEIIKEMNEIDKESTWKLISTKLIGQAADDEEKQ